MPDSKQVIYAIVPAAGIGKRMGARRPKQFLTLGNEPILTLTLKNLAASQRIEKFIIPSIDIVYTRKIIANYCQGINVEIIKGGKTRQDSVFNGLEHALSQSVKPDLVLVHDAVRALVTKETINNVIEAAGRFGSATAATPVTDTLKQSYKDEATGLEFIRKNVSRDLMWAAQTPQVFKTEILVKAYAQANKDKFIGTDSTGLVERIGEKVALVQCPNSNIKITTPEDLKIAESYLLQVKPEQNQQEILA